MDFKQLRSFAAVVQYRSFTKAAEKTYLSQPTVSARIRMLEEELHTRLLILDTKNLDITPKGWELYECATHILELQDHLLQRWAEESRHIIQLGASTIPSAYILPEILPQYGKLHPEAYFVVQQSDSSQVIAGLLGGLFDVGMTGMDCANEALTCIPFYRDRMVLITPVTAQYLKLLEQPEVPLRALLKEPIILREKGSGSQKSADLFLEKMHISEQALKVTARVNDQESIKNLVAGGLGVSIISEKAVRNFVEEKRLLMFELPAGTAQRNLYLVYPRRIQAGGAVERFVDYVLSYYALEDRLSRSAAGK